MSKFQSSVNRFSENVGTVRKKVLVGIQLSAELSKRSVVRQCLDGIGQITPNIVQIITDFTGNILFEPALDKPYRHSNLPIHPPNLAMVLL